MTAKKQYYAWIFSGTCFLIASICNVITNNWLGPVQVLVAILSFINAYQVKKKMN